MSKLEIAKNKRFELAIKKGIDNSRGSLFYKDNEGNIFPLTYERVQALACNSSYSSYISNPREKMTEANPGTGEGGADYVFLPDNVDTLVIKYGVMFHAPEIYIYDKNGLALVQEFLERSQDVHGYGLELYRELASRYVWNILNGRVFFRNRELTNQVHTKISFSNRKIKNEKTGDDKKIVINYVFDGNFNDITYYSLDFINNLEDNVLKNNLIDLIENIAHSLMGQPYVKDGVIYPPFTGLNIESTISLYDGAEIFPSQNFGGNEGRRFYVINDEQVGLHSQKIGNALRTIDTWYNEGKISEASPVEFFGYNKKKKDVSRYDHDNSIFHMILNYMSDWVVDGNIIIPDNISRDRMLYTLAVFCRGGILTTIINDKAKKEKEEKEA